VDISAGGAHYNHTGCQAVGPGTVADGMATIKQLVFEEKKVTAKQLLQALEDNWVGHEPLYALVNSDRVHHYGNDDPYADELAKVAISSYIDNLTDRPNARGGTFCPGVFSVTVNVAAGSFVTATPDGRRAGEPVSDCLGPVHTPTVSHDIKGPTAIAKSVGSLDQTRITNGTILNWKFTPNSVSGTAGRDVLIALNDVYFENNGLETQFNIVSRDTLLKAQAEPEKHRNLLVRVAGYSAYFTELDKQLQDDLIARTELSFD
jgi:formate C-acetyltransferase